VQREGGQGHLQGKNKIEIKESHITCNFLCLEYSSRFFMWQEQGLRALNAFIETGLLNFQ
jgi:hypothetical protein